MSDSLILASFDTGSLGFFLAKKKKIIVITFIPLIETGQLLSPSRFPNFPIEYFMSFLKMFLFFFVAIFVLFFLLTHNLERIYERRIKSYFQALEMKIKNILIPSLSESKMYYAKKD
ncbi:hypothetical protein BpHYR1_002732 [Brachionus plicatilis]|uniref:Uncharacterized protein n=1 Tax=Brachionus plicatilis TaxID=10195 RepID=A0A3M7Q0N0_BRAPC|nr:hypothetical protein BpHYR1_002732 [Brachionus plicatilis]